MISLSEIINTCAHPNLYILLPNLGPSCYNATILGENLKNVNKKNIIVATSDLGLDIVPQLAEIAQVPAKNIYCPPVWGFVGINHLVDIQTTMHRYNSFYPNRRHSKVTNSTLNIGYIIPEMRTLEYLVYNKEETLWVKKSKQEVCIFLTYWSLLEIKYNCIYFDHF